MKIALFAPWPPQRSGIADYSYRLAAGLLQRNVALDVFTAAASPTPLAGCAIHAVTLNTRFRLEGDALPVFQLGNNVTFHAFQPEPLARLGGLVQLHDPVLHHLHVDRTLAAGAGGYWEDLERWYGPVVARACRRLAALGAPAWSNEAVTAIPFFEPYLQFADAVLVHSQSALRAIHSRMPELRGYCLPQSYPLDPRPPSPVGPRDRPLTIGVFGWVEPHKRVDQILVAIAELRSRGTDIRLDICGQAGAMTASLVEQIDRLRLESAVRLRGHVEHERFVSAIADVDVCVNLRDPTKGETSAIVTQAMQLGTPVIVTDTGWYAELPDFVLKVPAGPGAVAALVAHLAHLDTDRHFLESLAASTQRYAATELNYPAIVDRYVAILDELADRRARSRRIDDGMYGNVALALSDLELVGSPQQETLSAGIIATLSPCF